ncbi:hypothetical protein [Treponema sp.]|uniref:hypothetical protein n=1 Tax=Treponema sp. TaxID=166 RepID=UPI001DB63D29|nr:hypothetical protein [Treponema sp.]MBS7240771.1 hypothetical protein [Treponema sp.]MDY4131728.1 hypothetical protein [Treponema sp.]
MKIIFCIFVVLSFFFLSCCGITAEISRRSCTYNSEEYEHVLCYVDSEGLHTVCLEEEFDLAEGEIAGFETFRRNGGISFVLYTRKGMHYVLNVNNDGSLVLHRFD